MIPMLTVLDERHVWHAPMIAAAFNRGYDAKRIFSGGEALGRTGLGFIRPHANPAILRKNQREDWAPMRSQLVMVQDWSQVEVYDNKSAQFARWGHLMPLTRRFTDRSEAHAFVDQWEYGPLVGKADVGASSNNVRILRTDDEKNYYVDQCFGTGLRVSHSAGGGGDKDVVTTQRGHCLLQEYIPNDFTWRVNKIGRKFAIFKRFNHPKKGTAQTGNVEPVMRLDDETHDLLGYSDKVCDEIASKWVAIDVLKTPDGNWRLIETSLAWPWPSPGTCDDGAFFALNGGRYDRAAYAWRNMWELMLDEYEAGVFQ